ncbi:NtaA/DmoA family FMN-dependent monooxygenase [Tropicimonas sp. IMCC34011]|uniref:NtaA/DmoA family FMN-dependent monooxygenase n=1 Tax=Tropicimonas sp. IMCC34011 TaxID=2248759 RepID=UPI0013008975|nr:NtaA/DmoA family FMN-dependent monooxygenase [Tropicimonas sp. IMCC34011]
MILNAVVFGFGSHEAAWRQPGLSATAPLELSHWLACGREAEAAGFDGLFLGDIMCLQDRPADHPSEALDPFMVLAAIAGATERLRLIGTASTSFNHPYHLARRVLSLHHLTGGRAGWNVVTSSYPQEARMFGLDEMPPTSERYAMAEEVVEAVKALWEGWDGVTRVADKASGRWLTGAPREVQARGRFGAMKGALNLSPEPYGWPLFAQAGSSPTGLAFAARHASQVFTVQSGIAEAQAFREEVRRLAGEAERAPDEIAVLPGLVPVVAGTREAAEAQLLEMTGHMNLEHVRAKLARFIGLPLDGYDLDAPFPHAPDDLGENTFSNSRARLLVRTAAEEGHTLRQSLARFAAGHGHLLVVGTGDDVAGVMREWISAGAADGFNVMAPVLPAGIVAFGEHVMPALDRGRPIGAMP